MKLNTGGRYIVTSGNIDLCIRVVRPEDASKTFSCLTTNTLTGERKRSDSVMLSIKGKSVKASSHHFSTIRNKWQKRWKGQYVSAQAMNEKINWQEKGKERKINIDKNLNCVFYVFTFCQGRLMKSITYLTTTMSMYLCFVYSLYTAES